MIESAVRERTPQLPSDFALELLEGCRQQLGAAKTMLVLPRFPGRTRRADQMEHGRFLRSPGAFVLTNTHRLRQLHA